MAGHRPSGSIDILTKTGIVVVLVVGMVLLHNFAVPSEVHPEGLLALGFVILAGFTIGQLVETVRLPHITGYLIAGLILGPSAAQMLATVVPNLPAPFDEGIINADVAAQLGPLNALALALIALTAGGELRVESLRKGLRQILGVLLGQVVVLFVVIVAFVYAISGVIPHVGLEGLVGVDLRSALALGAVVAAVSMATSPAATIAVINGTGSKGEMTDTVLSVVVLKDVVVVALFSVAMAVAVSVVPGAVGGEGLGVAFGRIGGALGFGAGVGLLIHLYLQYAAREIPILVFLVGTIYTTTFIAENLHFHPALVFIAAGFATANFSPKGEELIREVERLSLPVYVVFFTLAGAALHLGTLWKVLGLAVAMVGLRAVALYTGVRLGATLSGASVATRTYGWMGFLSQAGLAIVLAGDVKDAYPDGIGMALYTLILGGVAINEVFGPVLLQWGLAWSGEAGVAFESEETSEAPRKSPERADVATPVDDGLPDPWGSPLASSNDELNELVDDLGEDLKRLVSDLQRGPIAGLRTDGEVYLTHLRREFLRYHRRATVQVQTGDRGDLASYLRGEIADMGSAWRDHVLERMAARARAPAWDPIAVVDALDELVGTLPESIHVPIEPATIEPRTEGFVLRTRRRLLRARQGLRPVEREINLRDVARYHFSGLGPSELEGLSALLVRFDTYLADRTSGLFSGFSDSWKRLAVAAEDFDSSDELLSALRTVRLDMEEDFGLTLAELAEAEHDAVVRASVAFGGLWQDLKADVLTMGTLDLPHWKRRYGRVYRDRNLGLAVLTDGLAGARQTATARYAALALELELIGFEARIQDAVESHGALLARSIRGRGSTQLQRVDAGLATALESIESLIEDPEATGSGLAAQLRAEAEPLTHLISEANRSAVELCELLEDDGAVAPLIQSLLRAADSLTEWYTVPTERAEYGEWTLPKEVATTEVPFREIALGFIETAIARDLVELTRALASKAEQIAAALTELERVVAFNIELAGAELDGLLVGEGVPEDTRALVREMLLGAVGRSRVRLQRLAEEAEPWAAEAHAGVRDTVLRELLLFRGQMLDGEGGDLRNFILREVRARRQLVRRAEEFTGLLPDSAEQASALLKRALGEDRILGLRQILGLPESLASDRPIQVQLAPPRPHDELPVVYRRLFSDQALEAGDLLTGRQSEVEQIRAALTGAHGGILRTAALLGLHEAGVGAVANAAIRGIRPDRIRRIELDGPVTEREVDDWFNPSDRDRVMVVTGIRWLFAIRAGGFGPLRRFIRGVMDDSGRNAWLVIADVAVWRYAAQLAPLDSAFDIAVELEPLDVEDLSAAILARHAMSGYDLRFDATDDLGWQIWNLLSWGSDLELRRRKAWFHTLHDASAGVMHDALRLWLASIREVDDTRSTIHIGAVERPPVARISGMSDEVHLTLLQVLRQGWMSADLYAGLFRVDREDARARLMALTHKGLLVIEDGHYRVATHLRAPIWRVLQHKGWAA